MSIGSDKNKDFQKRIRPLLISICGFVGFIPLMMLPVMMGFYVNDLSMSQKMAGILCTAQLFGVSIGILLLSRYSIKHGLRKNVLCAALVVISVECASLFFDGFSEAFLFRLASGLGGGVIAGCAYSWLGGLRDPDQGFGLFLLVQFMTGALLLYFVPAGLQILGTVTVKLPYILFSCITLALSGIFSYSPRGEKITRHEHLEPVNIKDLLKGNTIIAALLAIGFFELAMSMVWADAQRIGVSWGFNSLVIAKALALCTLAGILGAFLVVALGSRFGRRAPIYAGVALISAVLIFMITANGSLAAFYISMVLFNGLWSFTVPYLQGAQANGNAQTSSVCLGAFFVTSSLSLGPVVSGVITENFGFSGLVSGALIFLLLSLLCAFMAMPAAQKRFSTSIS
ncbi:MFS transporter [Marinobacterium rhizophilum]|uniref:MFS transporter n=1 Tax=Marinobacterium rhizophilum TaxID=420402 RepID=A0ABY5HIW7_9GAMM|nr:MFS transporter [Marinobacterium rhizophilum]UTW12235.1 MFS transporter [Marinobacterium rhizophilum]